MSNITNTDAVVTESKLTEFYNDIKPFLGCPAYLTSEGTSDYYSTDEKVIGRWIDGKPIYQKTFVIANYSINNWYNVSTGITVENCIIDNATFEISATNNKLYRFTVGASQNDTYESQIWVEQDGAKIAYYVKLSNNYTPTNLYITLKYTKTTDSASTTIQENPNEYSTDEKIIGKWIDGKPLYQKTISCGTLPNNTTKTVNHNISDIDNVINYYGITWNAGKSIFFCLPYVHKSTIGAQISIVAGKTDIQLQTGADRSGFTSSYVTLQYTKTTD